MVRAAGDSDHYSWKLKGAPDIALPSVTHIIHSVFGANQWLMNWAANSFKDADEMKAFRDKRAGEGTKAHAYVEAYFDEPETAVLQATTGFDEAFLKYVRENVPILVGSENVVYSLKHGYAGTLDLILLGPGGTSIIADVKTKGSKIYRGYETEYIQCRLYAIAAAEMGLIPDAACPTSILILKENGRYSYDERGVSVGTALSVVDTFYGLRRDKV